MLRLWLLSFLLGAGLLVVSSPCASAQAKDPKTEGTKEAKEPKEEKKADSILPAGETPMEVAQNIAKELSGKIRNDRDTAVATFEKQVAAFDKKYAEDPVRWHLKMMQTQVLQLTDGQSGGGGKTSEEILKEIAAAKDAPDGLSELAKSTLESLAVRKELMRKPFVESFKTFDGGEVDFAKLRGKVVLVDFWATWCGPCMVEVPKLVETYKKLHDKGFEIVGISLDRDEGELKKVLAEKEMTWPQYFERKGENQLAKKYGINAIPEMWLVDKKGMVKMYSRSQDLAAEVEKLLAE